VVVAAAAAAAAIPVLRDCRSLQVGNAEAITVVQLPNVVVAMAGKSNDPPVYYISKLTINTGGKFAICDAWL
jgi:hypothetical protein